MDKSQELIGGSSCPTMSQETYHKTIIPRDDTKSKYNMYEMPLHIEVLNIPNLTSHGSKLFELLVFSDDERILSSRMLKTLIRYKWETYAKALTLFFFVVHVLYLMCFTLYTVFLLDDRVQEDGSVPRESGIFLVLKNNGIHMELLLLGQRDGAVEEVLALQDT